MRAFQVLIALLAVFLSPLVGLVAPAIAFFVVASGLSGLSAATWRSSAVVTVLLTSLQVAALAGSAFLAVQSLNMDDPTQVPTAQIPAGAGNIQSGAGTMQPGDRAAP